MLPIGVAPLPTPPRPMPVVGTAPRPVSACDFFEAPLSDLPAAIPADGGARVQGLTLEQVQTLVSELAPWVREATGYRLDLGQLNLALVDVDDLVELLREDLVRDGITTELMEQLPKSWSGFMGMHYPRVVGAAYSPSLGTLIVPRAHAEGGSWDRLRVELVHELVHVAQDHEHPAFTAAYSEVWRRYAKTLAQQGAAAPATQALKHQVYGRTTLLEGQAVFWQNRAAEIFPQQRNYQKAQDRWGVFKALTHKVAWTTARHYIRGDVLLDKIAKGKISSTFIERAFADPTLADQHLSRMWDVYALARNGEPGEGASVPA